MCERRKFLLLLGDTTLEVLEILASGFCINEHHVFTVRDCHKSMALVCKAGLDVGVCLFFKQAEQSKGQKERISP